MTTRAIETTDLDRPRLSAAVKSLHSWHAFRQDVLRRERAAFTNELAKTCDPTLRQELVDALQTNAIEQRELDAAWRGSTLRRRLTPGDGASDVRGVETRICASPSAGTSGAARLIQGTPRAAKQIPTTLVG